MTRVDGRTDRSLWIAVAGWIQLALAALLLATVPLTLAGSSGAGVGTGTLVFSVGFNVLAAAFLAWTGIGALRLKRWAPVLTLAAARIGLATGVAGLALWLWAMPAGDDLPLPPEAGELPAWFGTVLLAAMTAILAVVYVALPAAFILFFRSASVRATFERADASPSRVESLPSPVLSMTFSLWFLAATAALCSPMGVVAIFGAVVTGPWAVTIWIVVAAGLAALAWLFGSQRPAGWWGTLAATLAGTASLSWTFWRLDPRRLLAAAGFPPDQIEMFAWSGLTSRPALLVLTWLSCAALLWGLAASRRPLTGR